MTTKNKTDKATAIFNAIKPAVNLNNVELRNAAVQDALARFEFEHAALVAVAEAAADVQRYSDTPPRFFESAHIAKDTLKSSLANLAAVREGGTK